MKKYLKVFTAIAVLLLSVVLLVACDDTESKDKVTKAKDDLTVEQILGENTSKDEVMNDLVLKTKDGDVSITWESDNTDVITNKGEVTRQEEDVTVTLTATLKLNDVTDKKTFKLVVLKIDEVELEHKAYYDLGETGKFEEDETKNHAALLNLDENLFTVTGTVIQGSSYTNPIGLNKDNSIRLYASRSDGKGNVLTIGVKEGYHITSVKIALLDGNNDPFMGRLTLGDEVFDLTEVKNTTLLHDELSIDKFALANNQLDGSKSTQIWIDYIEITIALGEPENIMPIQEEKTDKELLEEALDELLLAELLGDNEDALEVTKDLSLPTKLGKVDVSWASDKEEVIANDGKVLRTKEDVTVTLTATLTIGEEEDTKEFEFKVLKLEEGLLQAKAEYNADTTGNMTAGNNAEIVNLDPELFTVISTPREIAPAGLHVGLNKAGDMRLYGNATFVSKSSLAITIKEGYLITGVEFKFKAGSNNPDKGLLLLGNEKLDLTGEDISNTTLVYDELSIDGFLLRNNQNGGDKNTQIWIESILITYEEGKAENPFTPFETTEVKFDTNGGNEIAPFLFEEGDEFKLPANPKKDGEDFIGWFLDEDLETELPEDFMLEEDITLYAAWERRSDEELALEAKNALTIDTTTITEDKTLELPEAGLHDAVITWEVVEGEGVIDLETGKVTLPNESMTLKLKATLKVNNAEETKEFEIEILILEDIDGKTNVLMIYEVYGAGGNSGAYYKYDFVTLYNGTDEDIDLSSYSLQYAAAAGTNFSNINSLEGTIKSKEFFVIQLAGGSNGIDLPAVDLEITNKPINMAAANGNIALVLGDEKIVNIDDSSDLIVDYVGFGTASKYEGSGSAPAPSTTRIIRRVGLIDTDDNKNDFIYVNLN